MIFRPFRRKPSKPFFPEWIKAQIDKPAIPSAEHHFLGPGRYLADLLAKSGLGLEAICERINQPQGKTKITPALVESALEDEPEKFWIINRIYKAFNISWDDYLRIEKEHDKLFHQADVARSQAQFLLNHYRHAGPSLHALLTTESWLTTLFSADPYHLTRQIHTGDKYQFLTPTAEEMAHIIATQPEPCTHPCAKEFHVIGAYLYHRHPHELHLFGAQGELLSSGDATLLIPNHLRLYQPKAPRIHPPKPPMPPVSKRPPKSTRQTKKPTKTD